MPEVGHLEPALPEPSPEGLEAARRATVEERWPVLGVEQVDADDALGRAVEEVERAVHRRIVRTGRERRAPCPPRAQCATTGRPRRRTASTAPAASRSASAA